MMKDMKKKMRKFFSHKKFKYGGYATAMIIFVIAAVLLVNVLVSALDENFSLMVDMTATRMYSMGTQTKTVLEKLDSDIYIYTMNTEDSEDESVSELLEKYKEKSKHIKVQNIDPVAQPGAVAYYQQEGYNISPGTIVLTDHEDTTLPGQRFKVLDVYDLYQYDAQTQNYTIFNAESALTSAIMYITNENLPRIWFLDGHNKDTSTWYPLRSYLEDENYEVDNLSLITESEKLEKGDILIVLAPEIDLNADERETLKEFMLEGGKLLMAFDTISGYDLPNFESLLALYNVGLKDGIVVEKDSQHYTMQGPIFIVPSYGTHDITSVLVEENRVMLLPYTGALKIPDVITDSSVEITSLLTTSDTSFIETDPMTADGEPDEGSEWGPFPAAIAITKTDYQDENNSVQMVITTSPNAILGALSTPTFGNDEFFINSIAWMSPQEDDIYIRGKSLMSPQLYFKSGAQVLMTIGIVCLLLPIAVFVAGIVIFLRRRHL